MRGQAAALDTRDRDWELLLGYGRLTTLAAGTVKVIARCILGQVGIDTASWVEEWRCPGVCKIGIVGVYGSLIICFEESSIRI